MNRTILHIPTTKVRRNPVVQPPAHMLSNITDASTCLAACRAQQYKKNERVIVKGHDESPFKGLIGHEGTQGLFKGDLEAFTPTKDLQCGAARPIPAGAKITGARKLPDGKNIQGFVNSPFPLYMTHT